jgi:hypothetical protein
MNANTNGSTSCNNVNYPTTRVITGVLGFLALCTIATNYAINAAFNANVFFAVIATSLVTCFAICTTSMWKSGYQVFSGNVDNAYDASCYWNTAAQGFLYAGLLFCGGAFFSSYAASAVVAVEAIYFPFVVSICGYWVTKAISNACTNCVIENPVANASNWTNNASVATNATSDINVTNTETVSS